jgi:hypothetical protein
MGRRITTSLFALALLAGCSSGGSGTPGGATGNGDKATSTSTGGAGDACSGGVHEGDPGVVDVDCGGTAEIKFQAGDVSRDMHGGTCRSAGDLWSAGVGVIIDKTGTSGTYTGPPVDNIVVNNTSDAGKATIQASIGGKLYFDLGGAALTRSADQKTAHIEGTGDKASDAPGTKIVIDVTC